MSWKESWRLRILPKLTHTSSRILGTKIELTDPHWYLYVYNELFLDAIYRYEAEKPNPYIIDCGANIGLSVIYFKYLYPHSRITAFEPDGEIFAVLERNMRSFRYKDVILHQKAVWNVETDLSFLPDGGVGGRLMPEGFGDNLIAVQTVRLRDFLNQEVDFLKIDIEGAEYEVVKDCREMLKNVRYIFVEYHGKQDETQKLHELLQILHEAGFRYHLKEAYPVEHPFLSSERRKPYDLQLNIFGFRD